MNSVYTSQTTYCLSITKKKSLIFLREITALGSENGNESNKLISSFHRASLLSVTFINQLMHSIMRVVDGVCRQTPTTHIISTFELLYVISVKYRLSLPDDGSYVIRNMLE